MKIIGIDNLDRDNINDILICENVHKYYIDSIIKILNDKVGNHNGYYCKIVEDNYKLYKFEY